MLSVGEFGPPPEPNLIVPVPLSPALSIISELASKSNVCDAIEIEVPSILKKLFASPLAKKSPVPSM